MLQLNTINSQTNLDFCSDDDVSCSSDRKCRKINRSPYYECGCLDNQYGEHCNISKYDQVLAKKYALLYLNYFYLTLVNFLKPIRILKALKSS